MPQVKKTEVSKAVDSILPPLKETEISQLEIWSGLSQKERKANNSLVEMLYGNGRRVSDLAGFNNDETDPVRLKFRDDIVLHIIKGWDDESRELGLKYFKADPETLSVKGKSEYAFYKAEYRNTYYNLRKALESFTKKGGKKSKAAKSPELVLALREFKGALSRLEKQAKGYDGIVDDIKATKALHIMTKVIDPNPPKSK